MRVTVGRTYRFRATHSLPGFPEPWCFPHQHDYTVEVEAKGDTNTDEIDARWKQVKPQDGSDLNTYFRDTTVEALAEHWLIAFDAETVTVWEDKQRWGRAER